MDYSLNDLKKLNISYICPSTAGIGKKLKNIFELCSIKELYYRGNLSLLEKPCIAVVGSRMPDAYGKKLTEDFTAVLAKAGLVIVSGLAAGVDTAAHATCLKNGGKTIAVLGSSLTKIYPAFNSNLAKQIVDEGGLILTEYAPGSPTNSYNFPQRNRIVAGISDAVLITQMGAKSGALHTKNFAVDYGRDLYIACADCYRDASAGNLSVIEEFPQSATVSPARILSDFGLFENSKKDQPKQLSLEEQAIVAALKDGEKHFDDIAAATALTSQTLLSLLTSLKICGMIFQLPNNFYCLAKEF